MCTLFINSLIEVFDIESLIRRDRRDLRCCCRYSCNSIIWHWVLLRLEVKTSRNQKSRCLQIIPKWRVTITREMAPFVPSQTLSVR